MSLIRQVLVSLIVIVFAALGWFTFSHRDLVLSDLGIAGATGGGSAAGASSGGAGNRGGAPGASAGSGRSSGGGGSGRGPSAAPVVAATVDIQTAGDRLTAIGTLVAVQEVTLFPQVSGVVTEIAFKPGSHV